MSDYNVYLLKHSHHNKTYLGITNNIKRRIRQHNGEIKGGAKYTTNNLGCGKWSYYLIIPYLTKSVALSIERIVKNRRRKGKGRTPLERRVYLIDQMNAKYDIFDE